MAPSLRSNRALRAEHWSVWLAAALGFSVVAALGGWLLGASRSPATPEGRGPIHTASTESGSSPVEGSLIRPRKDAEASGGGTPGVDPTRLAVARGQWSELPAAVRLVLKPLEDDWSELTPDQRLKWFDLARRFSQLPPDEQRRVQDRMVDWARMTPAERGVARLNFQEIRQVSTQERLERWEAYQGLEVGEKRQWAERAQATFVAPASPKRAEAGAPPSPKSSNSTAEQVAHTISSARPVSGTVVQAPWGATTVLVSRLPAAAAATGSGPKIAATAEFVDPVTLLPMPAKASGGGETGPVASTGPAADPSEAGSASVEPVTRPQP